MKSIWSILAVGLFSATDADFLIEKEFESVSCHSIIKIANKQSGFKLHSHDITYGTGSGQQSVTGYPRGDDENSYFKVVQSGCERGKPIDCSSVVQFEHLTTNKRIHSHLIASPISNQQEVSAYDKKDSGDDWIVGCKTGDWKREEPVTLQHVDTKLFLSSSSRYSFGQPIAGQLEVSARAYKGDTELWIAQEGIYISSSSVLSNDSAGSSSRAGDDEL